jgi:hypothetical protein
MNYIITEEELKTLVRKTHSHDLGISHYIAMEDFLKSKQPVTEIASGELFYEFDKAWIRNPKYDSKDEAMFKPYEGKQIKIYVEEI